VKGSIEPPNNRNSAARVAMIMASPLSDLS
jgi:hypothetical protein